MTTKNEAKALLARAGIKINSVLHRVDHMSTQELAETVKSVGSIRAFFDQNGSCGKPNIQQLRAFFDQNGSCGHSSAELEKALQSQITP